MASGRSHAPVLLARIHWPMSTRIAPTKVELWPGYGVCAPGYLTTNGHASELVRCLGGPDDPRQRWEAVYPGIAETLTTPLALAENLWRVCESIAPNFHAPEAFERWVTRQLDALRTPWQRLWINPAREARVD